MSNTEEALLRAVHEVTKAWFVVGSHPGYHYEQQMKLFREWPTLAEALLELRQAEYYYLASEK